MSSVSLLVKKEILMKAIPLVFTILFFMQIAPIEQLSFLQNTDFVKVWSGTLLFIVGLVFIVEYFLNKADAGNHRGAKTGAYIFLVMGLITFIYGGSTITGIYDPIDNAGNEDVLNIGLTILLGVSAILLYVGLHPTVVSHKHISFAKHVR